MALLTPQTGSIIEGEGGLNRTGTALSTNIVIKIGSQTVGAVQTLSVREQRNITPIDEVGTDGHIDSVPTKSADFSGDCRRIRFDRLRITEAFARGYLHVHAQRIPFDIVIIDKWNGDENNSVVTIIKNVWIQSIGYSYNSSDWTITDDMSWVAETISSTVNGKNAANGGERGIKFIQDTIEREADRGARRGALSNVSGTTPLLRTLLSDL